jgi:hypothetical protein
MIGWSVTRKMGEKEFGGKENIWWISWSILMILQIITALFFYNREFLLAIFVFGWLVSRGREFSLT